MTLRNLTPEQLAAWERWLLDHWGCAIFTALHEAGQPQHLPKLSYSSLRTLIRRLEQRTGRRWLEERKGGQG